MQNYRKISIQQYLNFNTIKVKKLLQQKSHLDDGFLFILILISFLQIGDCYLY